VPLLDWRDAERGDRQALQGFVCSPRPPRPEAGRYHIKEGAYWERDAQAGVRNMRPPAGGGEIMLVGELNGEIVAVGWSQDVDGPADVFINVAAISLDLRNGDTRGYGDELAAELINRLKRRAAADGHAELCISGKVHQQNAESQKLCARLNATRLEATGDLEEWGVRVAVP